MKWVLSCEHFTNAIPEAFRGVLDEKALPVLETHRGYDIGAAGLFQELKPVVDASFHAPFSRLLIEPNRSIHHRHLFSPFTLIQPTAMKTRLISELYYPYRKEVEDWIAAHLPEGVVHVSVHTFTPRLGNHVRTAHVGLLYDPRRRAEASFCRAWKNELKTLDPALKVRFNHPYRGSADGFTTYLRKRFDTGYLGIELEVKNTEVGRLGEVVSRSLRMLKDFF